MYPRSFADADGMGDLKGIHSRLPYLRDLGINAIWLSPFYKSPRADAGYDVADYRTVDPMFGDPIDVVPDHVSDQHAVLDTLVRELGCECSGHGHGRHAEGKGGGQHPSAAGCRHELGEIRVDQGEFRTWLPSSGPLESIF
ncbi:alpha-amylase family glycosyl hydrolase [Streptomyces sp. NPDC058297]|uniref:alpha-amylase family glycosyl hydrolase n=1 Tax=Streptomyces sp. NPDC058297 TaxID=3346433 RepID=UPI0036E40F4C